MTTATTPAPRADLTREMPLIPGCMSKLMLQQTQLRLESAPRPEWRGPVFSHGDCLAPLLPGNGSLYWFERDAKPKHGDVVLVRLTQETVDGCFARAREHLPPDEYEQYMRTYGAWRHLPAVKLYQELSCSFMPGGVAPYLATNGGAFPLGESEILGVLRYALVDGEPVYAERAQAIASVVPGDMLFPESVLGAPGDANIFVPPTGSSWTPEHAVTAVLDAMDGVQVHMRVPEFEIAEQADEFGNYILRIEFRRRIDGGSWQTISETFQYPTAGGGSQFGTFVVPPTDAHMDSWAPPDSEVEYGVRFQQQVTGGSSLLRIKDVQHEQRILRYKG